MAIRPRFAEQEVAEGEDAFASNLTVGLGWKYVIPPTAHDLDLEVFVYKVDIGKGGEFMDYDAETETITIEEGVTEERHVGSYPIKMVLIDETGVLSDKVTYTLDIVIPEEPEEEESSSESNFEGVIVSSS